MGRKLNALEEAQSSLTSVSAEQQGSQIQHQRSLELQRLIAAKLGIPVAQLSESREALNDAQCTEASAPPSKIALTQECRDLLEAFMQIKDPLARLRCLQIVREAATTR